MAKSNQQVKTQNPQKTPQPKTEKPDMIESMISELDEYDVLFKVDIQFFNRRGLVKKIGGLATISNMLDPYLINGSVSKFNNLFEGLAASPTRETVAKMVNDVISQIAEEKRSSEEMGGFADTELIE